MFFDSFVTCRSVEPKVVVYHSFQAKAKSKQKENNPHPPIFIDLLKPKERKK